MHWSALTPHPHSITFAQAAASYARRGFAIFPCRPGGKEPAAAAPHGLRGATSDPATVAAWWNRWPSANIGVNLGASQLVALDVDEPGLADAILGACPGLPWETWCQKTPRGGLHVVVGFEEGEPPRTRHLYDAQGRRLGELRCRGAYIVVWPSRTGTGVYELLSPRLPWEEGAVKAFLTAEDAEAYLLALLREVGVELREAAPRGAAFVKGQPLREGDGRNSALYLTGRRLLREGVPPPVVESILRTLNHTPEVIAEPLEERELSTVIQHVLTQPLPPGPGSGDGAQKPPAEVVERLLDEAFTDRNLARVFAELARDKALWVPHWGWLYWDGKRWARDEGGHRTMALAMDILPRFFAERAIAAQGEARKALLEMARKAMSRVRLTAALELAKGLVLADPQDFDRDPYLLNALNGIIDLRTGELRPHNPAARITKLAPVEYDPSAPAPTWERFLQDVFLGDGELIEFVQRAVGYSATADVSEDAFFLCYGSGSNGKTTFLNAIRQVLGDYGQAVAPDLLVSRRERGDSHPAVLADLYGARFCMTTETQEDRRLDEARVKMLTGRDPIKARYLHRAYFEFLPSHKIWLATNHLPIVTDTTEGMWRRVRVVPFLAYFGPGQRDKTLPQKLQAEAKGILAWIVRGAIRWYQEGLGEAPAVSEATSRYRSEMDTLADWLQECCEQDPRAVTPLTDLYASYRAWAEGSRETPLSPRAFGRRLSEKGYEAVKLTGGIRARRGLRLKSPPDGPGGVSGVSGVSGVTSAKSPASFETRGEFSESNAQTPLNATPVITRALEATGGPTPDEGAPACAACGGPADFALEGPGGGWVCAGCVRAASAPPRAESPIREERGPPHGPGPCARCRRAGLPGYWVCERGQEVTLLRTGVDRARHVLRARQAVCFNLGLLRAMEPDFLVVSFSEGSWGWVSQELARRLGHEGEFGAERQLAIPLSAFTWETTQEALLPSRTRRGGGGDA